MAEAKSVSRRTKSMADISAQVNRILSYDMDRTRRERVLNISSTYHNNIAEALNVSTPYGDEQSFRRQIPQSIYRKNTRR